MKSFAVAVVAFAAVGIWVSQLVSKKAEVQTAQHIYINGVEIKPDTAGRVYINFIAAPGAPEITTVGNVVFLSPPVLNK